MQIIYNGIDITSRVQAAECKYQDVSCGRCDSLHMVFNNGLAWNVWRPEKNDVIEVYEGQIYTGKMFIQAVEPYNNNYKIIATAARMPAWRKKTKSYENITLKELAAICAADDGMGYKIFGLSENTVYPYLIQANESNPKFLSKIAEMEGAVLKTYNGRYTLIGIAAAQERAAAEIMQLDTDKEFCHRKKVSRNRTVRVISPYCESTAEDKTVTDGEEITVSNLPVRNAGEAARMAKGILLSRNRKAEELTITTELHPGWTAMQKIRVIGGLEANGDWICDEVTHDLIAEKSTATFLRVIEDVE